MQQWEWLVARQIFSLLYFVLKDLYLFIFNLCDGRLCACMDPQMDPNSMYFINSFYVYILFSVEVLSVAISFFRYVAVMNAIFSAQHSMVLHHCLLLFFFYLNMKEKNKMGAWTIVSVLEDGWSLICIPTCSFEHLVVSSFWFYHKA